MAKGTKIVDPDDLTQNIEVVITPIDATATDPSSGTIRIQPKGDLATPNVTGGFWGGVALQTIYSFLKEEWKDDANLIKYPFPMIPITDEQFEFTNGWDLDKLNKDYPSWKAIRDGGWALKNTAGTSKEEYMNITTLGSFDRPRIDRAYFRPSILDTSEETSAATPSGFRFTGEVNEAVKIYGSESYGNFDFRDNFVIYLRERAKLYDSYALLTEQGLSVLTYKKFAMPLTTTTDLKINASDATIGGTATYRDIKVKYYYVAQPRTIGGTVYYFHIIIEGDGKTAQQIYNKVQYLLRDDSADGINTYETSARGSIIRGDIADELLAYTGDTLFTQFVNGWGGVYIDNFDVNDINNVVSTDDTNTTRPFPFTATGTISFNDNLVNDPGPAKWWMFFDTSEFPTSGYGQSDAIIVENAVGNLLTNTVSAATHAFTFAYDTNTQPNGGAGIDRSPKTDADVVVVAIGLDTAQFVKTTTTLQRNNANNISLVAALERNYSNN
jgi:hypothetical protein